MYRQVADKIRKAFSVEEGEPDSDESNGEMRERKQTINRTQSDGRLSKTNSVIGDVDLRRHSSHRSISQRSFQPTVVALAVAKILHKKANTTHK